MQIKISATTVVAYDDYDDESGENSFKERHQGRRRI